jgi:fructose-1,6-bisphosphatase II / sedoheptulose-1,7-bisphosphatase
MSESSSDLAKRLGAVTDRNLALELVRVTEAAAISAARWIGRGQKNDADGAAVEAMRKAFDHVAIDGTVVKVGYGGPPMDIAVDPLEGTTLTAKGGPNALAVVALAERGNFLHAPDIYMDKIAVGGGLPPGVVDLDAPVAENLRNLASASKREISDLIVCMLDRDRHKELMAKCREAGARITLLSDGDVAGVIAAATPATGVDIFMGSGGAPEGVLAAAALRCIGGQMQGRLMYEDDARHGRDRSIAQIRA